MKLLLLLFLLFFLFETYFELKMDRMFPDMMDDKKMGGYKIINKRVFSTVNTKKRRFYQNHKTSLDDKIEMRVIRNCSDPHTIALTFDDGPDPETTNGILDLLKKKNVTATFFLVARRLPNNQEAVNASLRTLNEGHQIAHHSFDHSNFTEGVRLKYNRSCEFLREQIADSDRIFQKYLNVSPKYFRPPYGEINNRILNVLDFWGYKTILWNLDTYDWFWDNDGRERLEIVESYKESFEPDLYYDSFISLQHDKGRNVEANRERYNYIIDFVHNKGFRFVSMDECLHDHHGPYFKKENEPMFRECNYPYYASDK